MAVTTDDLVDFLETHGSLRLGDSPWRSVDEDNDVRNVDWDALFPRMRTGREDIGGHEWDFDDDVWDPHIDDEAVGKIVNALDRGRPLVYSYGESMQWDVCAWYQPIHFHGHSWGIFIKEQCVIEQAAWIARFLAMPRQATGNSLRRLTKALLRAAVYAYFLHEQYHHKVESLGFRLHVVDRTSRYLPYYALVYQRATGREEPLEEALANAYMYRRLTDAPYRYWITDVVIKALRDYLEWSFPFAPPGYCCAVNYLRNEEFGKGENTLQSCVKEASLTPSQPASDWQVAPRMMQGLFNVSSDIWTVVSRGATSVLPARTVQPGITCSTAEMIRLYKSAGYEVVSGGKGSHVKLQKAGAPSMILPGNRRELSVGVLKTALRILDLQMADLAEWLAVC